MSLTRLNIRSFNLVGPHTLPRNLSRSHLCITNGSTPGTYGIGPTANIPLAANEVVWFRVAPTGEVVVNTAGDYVIIANDHRPSDVLGEGVSEFGLGFNTEFN